MECRIDVRYFNINNILLKFKMVSTRNRTWNSISKLNIWQPVVPKLRNSVEYSRARAPPEPSLHTRLIGELWNRPPARVRLLYPTSEEVRAPCDRWQRRAVKKHHLLCTWRMRTRTWKYHISIFRWNSFVCLVLYPLFYLFLSFTFHVPPILFT